MYSIKMHKVYEKHLDIQIHMKGKLSAEKSIIRNKGCYRVVDIRSWGRFGKISSAF